MLDTSTTFEATLSNAGKLSTTKKSSLQHDSALQYFRLFIADNAVVKIFDGAPLNSLLEGEKINGRRNVLILQNCSVLIILRNFDKEATRVYFLSYATQKRTSLKRGMSY